MKAFPVMYLVYNEYSPDGPEFAGVYHSRQRAENAIAGLNGMDENRPWQWTMLIVEDTKE